MHNYVLIDGQWRAREDTEEFISLICLEYDLTGNLYFRQTNGG
ncbi:hypothetical protein LCGC14_0758150 [marine sediment metagenome]|uniref:Uncharacterized protein n=1 Tax=marine sediment metagenome TaxID=412755 RepID=A0A0F9T927_9ZZZZ